MPRASRSSFPLPAIVAALAWFGLALLLRDSIRIAHAQGRTLVFGLGIFLAYFTCLTNLLVGATMTVTALAPASRLARVFAPPPRLTPIVTSILFVGIVYHLLLRHIWHPSGLLGLANLCVHYVVPGLCLLYWLLTGPRARLSWRAPLAWSLYPTLYFVWILARGRTIGLYPYPFLDVSRLGYPQVLLNSAGLWVAYVALGMLLVALGRVRR
jgi:hypothetical protein